MLQLKELTPIARGGKRACYRHPSHEGYCIKVFLPGKSPVDQKKVDPWWKQFRPASCYDENLRDQREFTDIYKKAGEVASRHFPKTEGLVETDMGTGLSIELITDSDQQISLSLKEYIMTHGLTRECTDAVDALEAFLLKHRIHFRDPFPHNIVFRQRAGSAYDAVIIDGLGNSASIPFHKLSDTMALKQIRKKIARLRKGMKNTSQAKNASTEKGMRVTK